jgi:hypothetical protein
MALCAKRRFGDISDEAENKKIRMNESLVYQDFRAKMENIRNEVSNIDLVDNTFMDKVRQIIFNHFGKPCPIMWNIGKHYMKCVDYRLFRKIYTSDYHVVNWNHPNKTTIECNYIIQIYFPSDQHQANQMLTNDPGLANGPTQFIE